MKKKLSRRERKRRNGRKRRRSRLYEACSWRNFLHAKILRIVKGDGNVDVHLLFLCCTLPLSWGRRGSASDPEIPTRRCGYWTYFSKANWGEPRTGSVKNSSCRDYITILYMIHETLLLSHITTLYMIHDLLFLLFLSLSISLDGKIYI